MSSLNIRNSTLDVFHDNDEEKWNNGLNNSIFEGAESFNEIKECE